MQLLKRNILTKYQAPLALDVCREIRPSYINDENPNTDFRGFANLVMVLMFSNNLNLIIGNFLKYGFMISDNFIKLSYNLTDHGFYIGVTGLLFFYFMAYYLEVLSLRRKVRTTAVGFLYSADAAGDIDGGEHAGVPHSDEQALPHLLPYGGSYRVSMCFFNMMVIASTLKIISFFVVANEVNYFIKEINEQRLTFEKARAVFKDYTVTDQNLQLLIDTPDTRTVINAKDFLFFIFMPTLCYQISYPRTQRIRVAWLLQKLIEFLVCMALLFFIMGQYMMPIMNNYYREHANHGEFLLKFKNILKLALPNTIIWILMFYACFQAFLNVLAELTYFADREFYKDWWNCRDLGEYWRLWNLPVHNWFVRHLCNPLLKRNYSREIVGFQVFFISALAHEYLISVALLKFSYWSFLAMLSQSLMILFEKQFFKIFNLKGTSFGNFSFWVSFCILGQPIILVSYYVDYSSTYGIPTSLH